MDVCVCSFNGLGLRVEGGHFSHDGRTSGRRATCVASECRCNLEPEEMLRFEILPLHTSPRCTVRPPGILEPLNTSCQAISLEDHSFNTHALRVYLCQVPQGTWRGICKQYTTILCVLVKIVNTLEKYVTLIVSHKVW